MTIASATPDPVTAPLSVWATAQRDARTQRRHRYLAASAAHPGKMLPAIAATAIARYTRPGDLVVDPMCGIGTTLVEAVHLGRHALGVEYEPRWAELAAANVAKAHAGGAAVTPKVITGDARQIQALAGPATAGTAALVITSPPYGASIHGQVRADGSGVQKYDNRYGHDPGNLAYQDLDDLLAGFTAILAGCRALLRPGGLAVITARPWRRHGELTDLPAAVIAAGKAAGLVFEDRCVALLAGLRDGQLIARPSFFQLDNVRKARAVGQPWHLITHEDVLILRAPCQPVPGAAGQGRLPVAGGGSCVGGPD